MIEAIKRFIKDDSPSTNSPKVVSANVEWRSYNEQRVRNSYPEYDDLDALEMRLGDSFRHQPDPLDAARIEALNRLSCDDTARSHNTQLQVFHENIVDAIDPNQTVTAIEASHLALGDDDTTPAYGDTGLTNELRRDAVDSTTDNGNDLVTSTLLGSGEGNGNTYRELGLVSASSGGTFLNHSLFLEKDKTSGEELTFQVTLEFRAA